MAKKKLKYGFQESMVTFVDLLGFKASIFKAQDNLNELSKIKEKVKSLQKRFGANGKKGNQGYKVKVHSFSDCIVREREYFRGVLYSEISSIAFSIIETLEDGYLTRGALTHGLHYSSKKVIVSPAFLKAYDLETKEANFPRVIIDPVTLAYYENRIDWGGLAHSHEEDKKYVYSLLLKDPVDGYYFIDYLTYAYVNSDDDGPKYLQHLLRIQKKIILEGLQNQSSKIRKKYQWLGWYQNFVISRYPNYSKGYFKKNWKKEYQIDTRLL